MPSCTRFTIIARFVRNDRQGRSPRRAELALLAVLLLAWAIPCAHAQQAQSDNPVTIGVDMAGSCLLNGTPSIAYWSYPPYYQAMADLGAQYACIHLYSELNYGDQNSELTRQKILAMDAGMRAHGMKYTLSTEDANFNISAYVTSGVNEYAQPDGTHRWDVRMNWLDGILTPTTPAPQAFLGMVYDEPDLMQLENNRFCNDPAHPIPDNSYDVPYLANTRGLDLVTAFDQLATAGQRVVGQHYQGRVPVYAEQLWPDMFPVFARGGWQLTPKALKENFTSVILSSALGAAIEYQDRTSFNVVADMWNYYMGFPGHSTEALRSALLMGYWLGADTLYVENADYAGSTQCYAGATPGGGLIRWLDTSHYEITPHGKVAQDFFKNYVPTHPRTIRWRDYYPRVAFIRLPDGDWGQKNSFYLDRLLGNADMPTDTISAEWRQVWPILTHGAVKAGSLSYYNWNVYPDYAQHEPDFFVPIDSVAVFDHLVTGPVLDGVECFIVCGHALSDQTFNEIRTRMAQGASRGLTCIISRRLYSQHTGSQQLPGHWVIVDSFTDQAVATALQPYLGPPDVARFRFRGHVVEFHKGATKDAIDVQVLDNTSADPEWMTLE